MSDSESDSDDGEFQIKRYFNNDLLSAIQQAKHKQETRGGIKRAAGHHLLRNKKHAVIEKIFQNYTGNHWDVDCDNRLERATRRMTIHAVNAEVSKEQLRRVREEKQNQEEASKVLFKVNQEFWSNVALNERRQKSDEMDELHSQQQKVSNFQTQLIRRHNIKVIEQETEVEKQRQLQLLSSMKNKASRTASQEDLMYAMADSNKKKSMVQTDLVEAFARFEDGEDDVNKEYDCAMFEVMDEALNTVKQMFSRQRTKRLSMDEQQRRVKDLRKMMNDNQYKRSMEHYNKVMGNLRNSFQRVWKREEELNSETMRLVEERRLMMQEQLVRKHAMKWVNAAFAKERQRQISDYENNFKKPDPFRDVVKIALAKAQREMILQKFNGKWVDTRKKDPEDSDAVESENVSEFDKKMKMMRMKSRRKSCVIRGDDD